MRQRMIELCPHYWENPALYTIENEEALKSQYSHLQLHASWPMRQDALCPSVASQENESALAGGGTPAKGQAAAD